MAKGKPQKQITSGFSEPFALQCLARCMYIKIYLQNIKEPLGRWKNSKTISAHAESTDFISLVIKKP
jgi:hypothetical protein